MGLPEAGSGRRRRPLAPVERQPIEYVAYKLMAHLIEHRENARVPDHACKGPCAAYHLSTKVYDLKTQKQERIQAVLELLAKNGFVRRALEVENATYYEITDVGDEWYRQAALRFYAPFQPLYRRRTSNQ